MNWKHLLYSTLFVGTVYVFYGPQGVVNLIGITVGMIYLGMKK